MHAYLGSTVIALVFAAALFTAMKEQRLTMVVSGLLLLPFFPLAILFEHDYWLPRRHGGWAIGVEDALFTFLSAALAWAIAVGPWRATARAGIRLAPLIGRGVAIHVLAVLVFVMMRALGAGVMTAYLFSHLPVIVVLLWLRPSLWRLAINGLAGFSVVYIAGLQLFFLIWPSFRAEWTDQEVWGRFYRGLPLGDVAWAAVFGAGWPLIVAFACDVRMPSVGRRELARGSAS